MVAYSELGNKIYDKKWSYFVANYISGILRDVLGLKINLVIIENAVNFKVIHSD